MRPEGGPAATLLGRLVAAVSAGYDERPAGWAAVPAGRALADHVVCAAAGRAAVDPSPGGAVGEVAARAAAAAHLLDRDDLHWESLTHPGGVVWPVVLGLGEERGAGGAAAVRAAALGHEVTAQLAVALGAPHRRYWHATTTAGAVGAAVAGALVAGGDLEVAATAAAHAASVAGGLIQTVFEHSGTRLFHRAHAARTAVAAAGAALDGLPATRAVLEGPRGLLAASGADVDPERLPVPLPGGWAIERLTLRPYAASGFTHAAVDAALQLAPLAGDTAERVVITTTAACLALAADPGPGDRAAAWYSVQHAVAACLLAGDAAILERHGGLDPAVLALLSRTEVGPNPDPEDLSATVEVHGRDGLRRATCRWPSGHPEAPLDDAALQRKWSAMLPRCAPADLARVRTLAADLAGQPLRATLAGLRAALAEEAGKVSESR